VALERGTQRAPAVAEKRPAPALARAPQLATSVTATHSARAPQVSALASGAVIQRFANVSSPSDRAEVEAVSTARTVMRMSAPSAAPVTTSAAPAIHRASAANAPALNPRPTQAPVPAGGGSGAALPAGVRKFMEPRFGADLSDVRVHTDATSASRAKQLDAVAFTTGKDIHFGRGRFQPDTPAGKELIAHELTHTIQQGAVKQSPQAPAAAVRERPAKTVHRSGGILDWFADKANNIPGFRMFCIVLGVNPINMAAADRSAGNVLRAVIEFMPGGKLIGDALESHGIFERIGSWVDQKLRTLNMVGSSFKAAISKFVDGISLADIAWVPGWGDLWESAKRIFTEPIERVKAFVSSLATEIIQFIREAILLPLAALAEGTQGYDLLKAVLGEDPVTGQPVARSPENLIGGFMKLIGEQEIWENMKKANAVARCWAWFQGALNGLMGFVRRIPGEFVAAFKSLQVIDMILVPRAFAKIAIAFGSFLLEFLSWAGNAMWKLLEIIFEVVAPTALPYLKKAAGSFKDILKNPIPFVSNLVKAGKLGFQKFADNVGTHLKKALIEWLTGSLPSVYIPQKLDLKEIVKFVLSVLGLTWANIRAKLVKAIGETAVTVLETGFKIVATLVTEGPAAAWEQIKEQLADLKDKVIGGITSFVVETIVKKAVLKVVSMLIPGGAFLQAIISIYETVMVFIDKLAKIIAVGKAFLDSIMDIASGKIENAAKKVESVLAGLLSLAISFLAGFLSLGKISDKVMEVIKKIRAPIDKALDYLVDWIVKAGKSLIGGLKKGIKGAFDWAFSKSGFDDGEGDSHSVYIDEVGGQAQLMVASKAMPARTFLDDYIKTKSATYQSKNKTQIAKAEAAIKAAEAQVKEVDKQRATGKTDAQLKPQLQKLLTLNVAVSTTLSALLKNDSGFKDAQEKYLLEGLCGTYGSIPKPKGDDFTADHQPQAAVLQAAAKFRYFKGTDMIERAAARAHEGFAINLHKTRHAAGRTYGSKGAKTKDEFLARARAKVDRNDPEAKQRKTVVKMLKEDVKADAAAMNKVAKDKAHYDELKTEFGLKDKAAKNLINEISGRITAGEAQIVSQDLDSLAD
jgi:hypothetical protein